MFYLSIINCCDNFSKTNPRQKAKFECSYKQLVLKSYYFIDVLKLTVLFTQKQTLIFK